VHVSKTGSVWVDEHDALTDGQACAEDYFRKCLDQNDDAKKGAKTSWKNISLDAFLSCPNNLAFNRQTRMLALYDARMTVCDYLYNNVNGSMDVELLARAKRGLHSLSFFGLAEEQRRTRLLFGHTFTNLKFKTTNSESYTAKVGLHAVNRAAWRILFVEKNMLERIEALNSLDLELYKYAYHLFHARLRHFGVR
jgi:hypothetical protein